MGTNTSASYGPEISVIKRLEGIYLDADVMEKDVFIFLCGGASPEQAAYRVELGSRITSAKKGYAYHVVKPEDLFLEQIYGNPDLDLLNLENLLAKSVDSIVIPIESPGTFSELGAFANHDGLKNKLIILGNRKYKTNNSFINKGPLKRLRLQTKSEVLWVKDFYDPWVEQRIRDLSRTYKKASPATVSLDNPITSTHFYQALLYVLAPINIDTLKDLMTIRTGGGVEDLHVAIDVTLNALKAKGLLQSVSKSIQIIPGKSERFFNSLGTRTSVKERKLLSDLRLDYLNMRLRGKNSRHGLGLIA